MVVLLAGEPREVVHDDEVDLALVGAAVLQQGLKLVAVRRLGTLAFFVEAFEDLVALPAAVLLAGTELRRQTEVLSLFLRADANLDHGTDHRSQLRPILRVRQGGRYAAHFQLLLCGALLEKYLHQDTCHGLGMPPNAIDVLIRQTVSLVAQ